MKGASGPRLMVEIQNRHGMNYEIRYPPSANNKLPVM
jgi:hypothetical protein